MKIDDSSIMNQFDRIAYLMFWSSIVGLFFYFVGLPIIVFTVPGAFEKITANGGQNPYNLLMSVIGLVSFLHWVYCIWFLFKYDRYSKSIFPLFFLNCLYAPIYFYRVKIKKRPLRNKINQPKQETDSEDRSISDEEFEFLTRNNVFGLIDLWASEKQQFEYQKEEPMVQVSTELFCQWEDFYHSDSNDFKQAFSKNELEILTEFDEALIEAMNKVSEEIPPIDEFMKTQEWIDINRKAIEVKNKLNTLGKSL